ncbi:MAG: hypothetical protein IPK59_17900 [Rhodospirillaceae bacterium]|nr:hypothetical protein [Rhodospirillaceae bacterium]
MKTVRKFMFETDFDDAPEASPRGPARKVKAEAAPVVEPPPPPPPPPAPTFSEAELAAAVAEARASGLKEGISKGRTEAQAQIEAQIASALGSITGDVAALTAKLTTDRATILGEAAGLALAMTAKMLPEFTRRGGLAEVEAVIEQCLVDLRREPRLNVRVPADLLQALQAKITEMANAQHFEGRVTLLSDPTLSGASCRIEWADGGLERHDTTIWQQVSAALDRCLTLQGIVPVPQPDITTSAAETDSIAGDDDTAATTRAD